MPRFSSAGELNVARVAPESRFPIPKSPLCRWDVPGKSISIYLGLDVVDQIERAVIEAFRAVTSRGSEVGGVLLGRSAQRGNRVVIVESFEAVACDYARGPLYLLSDADRQRFEEVLARRKNAGPLSVVGFFRGNTRRDIVLEDDDLALINAYFPDPSSVFLLVKPSAKTPSTGAFFFRENGEIETESSYLQFPFTRTELETRFARQLVAADDASVVMTSPPAEPAPAPKAGEMKSALERPPVRVRAREPFTLAATAPAPPKPEQHPAGPVLVKKDERKVETPPKPSSPAFTPLFGETPAPALGMPAASSSRRWLWIVVLALVLAAAGSFAHFQVIAHRPGAVQAASETLDLKVEQIDGVALLSWNWWSPVIRTAERATLKITDGDHTQDIDLDLGKLRAGRVAYSAKSNNVSFRLEVTDLKHGRTQSNTVRVAERRP